MEQEFIDLIKIILKTLKDESLKKIETLKIDRDNAYEEKRKITIDGKFLSQNGNYNFFSRTIFKRKEYQEYLNNREKSLEDNKMKSIELIGKIDTIDKNIRNEENVISKIDKNIHNISNIDINVLNNYFNNYQEIDDFCKRNNIKLSHKYQLYFGKDGNDIEFMKSAILEDFRLIVFDKTYSLDVYKAFIDKLNEYMKINFSEMEYKSNLDLFSLISSGKYDEHFVKHIMDYLKSIISRSVNIDDLNSKIVKYYLGLSSSLDNLYQKYKKEDLGGVLERLYEQDECIIGCHGTSYKPDGDIVESDKIFEKGIKAPIRSDSSNAIHFTVAYNIPFLEVLDYNPNKYGSVSGGHAYILAIPKEAIGNEKMLWGKDENGDLYIMPKYIIGKYKTSDNSASFILNSNSNKKDYSAQEIGRNR